MKTQQQNPCDKNIFAFTKHINNVHCTYFAGFFKRANTIFLISMNLISISSIKLVHGMSNRCQTLISFCSRWFHQLRQIAMRPNFRFYSAIHKKNLIFFSFALFSTEYFSWLFNKIATIYSKHIHTFIHIIESLCTFIRDQMTFAWLNFQQFFFSLSLSILFFRNNVNEKNSIELSNK